MGSIYYCFLCNAEFNTYGEWNAHLNVKLIIIFDVFQINVYIFCRNFIYIFLSQLRCLAVFWCDIFESVQVVFFPIFSSQLHWLAILWCNIFEPVHYMFIYDRICSRYVWTSWFSLCWRSKKVYINLLLFFFLCWKCL